jgi:fused signal recognition particle receptor
MGLFKVFSREKKEQLNKGLEKSKYSLYQKLSRLFTSKSKIEDDFLDELEEILISADVGVETTLKIIKKLKERALKEKYANLDELNQLLKEEIISILCGSDSIQNHLDIIPSSIKPYVMLVVGVNGVGKTTTIGKLAYNLKNEGYKVILGAADTYRAAAVEQLKLWAKRADVPVVEHGMNTDPSSVAFDAVKIGLENNYDVVIIDTAGRLHTKTNLMAQLGKIKRVIQKIIPEAPHEVLLVIDGSTGQNAFIQAKEFTKATEVTSLAVTKLDGSAKGGVIIGISDQLKIPIKFIGIGEKPEDLQIFNKKDFVEALLS